MMFIDIEDALKSYLEYDTEYNYDYLHEMMEYMSVDFLLTMKDYTKFLLESEMISDKECRKKMLNFLGIVNSCLCKQVR